MNALLHFTLVWKETNQSGQANIFWIKTVASNLEVLILIPAFLMNLNLSKQMESLPVHQHSI